MSNMLPAGVYYVGDLCYVLDEEWPEVCDLIITGSDVNEGVFALKDGRTFGILSTAYGDGTYDDHRQREYSVDSGMIGCILLTDLVGSMEKVNDITERNLGQIVEMFEPFEPSSDGRNLTFGDVEIDTDPQDEDYWGANEEADAEDWLPEDDDEYDEDQEIEAMKNEGG